MNWLDFKVRKVKGKGHGITTYGKVSTLRGMRLLTYLRHAWTQWLNCNGTQGNAVSHLQFMAQSVPPPQIVIMLGKAAQT